MSDPHARPAKAGGGFSQRMLDVVERAGNSVRGQLAARFLSRALGMDLFLSRPEPGTRGDTTG